MIAETASGNRACLLTLGLPSGPLAIFPFTEQLNSASEVNIALRADLAVLVGVFEYLIRQSLVDFKMKIGRFSTSRTTCKKKLCKLQCKSFYF